MSYGYSSTYPRVPNSTPQLPSSIRPPIHNPYDKFTQPQFDEWIGGITGALRKALGQEEEAPASQVTKPREGGAHPVADINDDSVEDSFAEWRAVRTKEKGKMRATEREQDSEYGGSQESYGDSGAQDHPAGSTPSDAIELLSDEDDAQDEETNHPGIYDNESYDGGLVENSSSAGCGSEPQRPVAASSQLTSPSKLHDFFTNAAGQEAIEISDGETEEHDQANDFPDAENVFFGWAQEEEVQQIPDIRDPWQLPKTYAEDLYTGGPIREPDRARLSPSHLTPVSEDANHFDDIDPQLRPSSVLVSKPTDHNLAEVSRDSVTPTLIPSVTEEANGDDQVSAYGEDVMEPDTPTGAAPQDDPDFISFTALNQPSDIDSERGEPEILYISENDGRESSTDDEEAEEDDFDEDGPIPLGTSDLEIPAEHKPDEDREEELDELEDDDEPVPEVPTNQRYGYYGLDTSSATGSGGLDDEAKTVGPPSDPPKGDQGEAPGAEVSQDSASMFDHRDLAPLPAAAAFVGINHGLQSTVSIDDTTKISLAGVSLASLDGIFTDEAVAGKEDGDSADEDAVGDDTVLVDEAVLTINEVEEVLRHAFAAADQSVSIASEQGATLVSDIAPSIEEPAESTSRKPDPSGTAPEIFAGGGPLPHEPSIEGVGRSPIEPSQSATKDKILSPQEQRQPLPFVMPLVANPNVRDPMSAPWSPVQSGPPTPVAGPAYLPAVTKFKRDNQLLGTANTNSGLFTPLEGSGSSSPSPSDGATPEELSPSAETKITVVEEDEQHPEERATSVLASPTTALPETTEVEPEAVPASLSEGDGWGDIPRLPTPPTEREDLPTGPVTRVFFQPEAPGDVGGLDARTEADRSGDALPALVVGIPREGNGNAAGLGDVKPLFHTTHDTDLSEVTDDPFKLMGNNSTVAPGAATNDDDGPSIASSPPDEERTPRLKTPEIPASIAEDPQTAESIHPEIQLTPRSPTRIQGGVVTPTETRKNVKKRKRSESTPVNPEDSGPVSTVNGKVSEVVTASLGKEERELTSDEHRDPTEEHDSDNESFTSSLVAPRNVDPSSHDGSRASSVISEPPLLLQGHSPVSEDAPVFHGHGKFKAALQALKALRKERNRSRELEPETEKVEEKRQEQDRPVAVKMESRKSSENHSNVNTETNKPPLLILPEVSAQPSLPSASTSQSPRTPTSALPPPSPTVVTAPVEATPPLHQERTAQKPAELDREVTQKPTAKTVKRAASRKRMPLERRSTRSQCRYHKISLPREENGPRVTFCVPECSINNKELMEEEDITDDGPAAVRDFECLWDRVEEKNLSPYLIGTIRQLVGVDLVRDNEIYYLPTEADVKWMEQKKKWERRKSRKSIGSAASVEGSNIARRPDSVSIAGSASQPSRSQVEKGKVGPPPSFAESISTVSTRSKIGQEGSIRSISEDEVSNDEGGERARKRRRRGGRERDGDGGSRRNTPGVPEDFTAPSTAGSPVHSQSTIESTPMRRSRRALRKATSADVQAYKPPISSGGESSEDEAENVKARRKSGRGGKKGLKRRRPDFIVTCDGTMPVVSGNRGAPPSPISTRSKRAKMDEK